MNINILNLKSPHLISLFLASAVNIGAMSLLVGPSKSIRIEEQVIQVSFVAPSSIAQKKSADHSKKEIIFRNSNNPDAIKVKKESKEKQSELQTQELANNIPTSGRQKEDATATKSAESEPIFDAAYLNNPAPVYPIFAKRRNIQGKVLMLVLVKADGTPAKVAVSKSSGHEILDQAAIEAIKEWRFIPAHRGNDKVEANVIVPVEFKLS